MNYGYQAMATLPFLTIGFICVALGALGFGITFALGPIKGGRFALKFSRVWAALTGVAISLTALFAYFTGQLTIFLKSYGYSPLLEMVVLAAGWIVIMWFMATQYATGRIALDEKFGTKENRAKAIEDAKHAQQEHYRATIEQEKQDA